MAKKIIFAVLGVVMTAGVIFLIFRSGGEGERSGLPVGRVQVGSSSYTIEIANTPGSQERGLYYRKSLAQDHGMLFLFPAAKAVTFWMKGMEFPLDFVWVNGRKVVGVTENAPPDNGVLIYGSPGPVDKVLEISAGEVKKKGIASGDAFEFSY